MKPSQRADKVDVLVLRFPHPFIGKILNRSVQYQNFHHISLSPITLIKKEINVERKPV